MAALVAVGLVVFGGLSGAGQASAEGTRYYEQDIRVGDSSRRVQVVEVDLDYPGLELDVAMSHDRLGGAESFKAMVEREGALAAINANFFHAYSHLDPIGTLAKDGEIFLLEGGQVNAGITGDNRILFNEASTLVEGRAEDPGTTTGDNWRTWYVNTLNPNEHAMALYTPRRGDEVEIAVEGGAVIVDQDVVQGFVDTPATVQIPPRGLVIFCGAKVVRDYRDFLHSRFVPGREVSFDYQLSGEEAGEAGFWDRVEHLVTAGPRLIREGQLDRESLNEYEEKISTQRGQRSALGVTGDDKMLLVTVSSVTVSELGEIMASLGARDAMNLDGGASSALYYQGEIKTSPGRELSTLLVVKEREIPAVQVEIDGELLPLDVAPVIREGRVMVPMRSIFEALGAEIEWDAANQRVSGQRASTHVSLTIGEPRAELNGAPVQLDVPAEISAGRTLVPTRFVAESLGARVKWDAAQRLVQVVTQ